METNNNFESEMESFNAQFDDYEKPFNEALQKFALYLLFTEEQKGNLSSNDVLVLAETAKNTISVLMGVIHDMQLEQSPVGGIA